MNFKDTLKTFPGLILAQKTFFGSKQNYDFFLSETKLLYRVLFCLQYLLFKKFVKLQFFDCVLMWWREFMNFLKYFSKFKLEIFFVKYPEIRRVAKVFLLSGLRYPKRMIQNSNSCLGYQTKYNLKTFNILIFDSSRRQFYKKLKIFENHGQHYRSWSSTLRPSGKVRFSLHFTVLSLVATFLWSVLMFRPFRPWRV